MNKQKEENNNAKSRNMIFQIPLIKELEDRNDFDEVASVELNDINILDEATNYISSTHMTGKARRKIIASKNQFIFEFENELDALAFKLKFA